MSSVSYNGQQYSEEAFATAARIAINQSTQPAANAGIGTQLRTPSAIQSALGQQYDGERDLYEVLGYPENPDIKTYRARYERGDIGERIVSLPAHDTWKNPPELFDAGEDEETAFTKDIETLEQQLGLWNYVSRTDKIAGIGEFGLLYIGVAEADEADAADPLAPGSLNGPDDVEFLTPFAQDAVRDWDLGKEQGMDPTDERYNLPVVYEIDFSNPDETGDELVDVHYTRVAHFPATARDESDLKASPRMQSVLNRLIDLDKVVGAAAEMFWSGADRKLQFDISSENAADIPDDQLASLDAEVQALVHDMQQHIKTFNTDIEVIGGDDPDPTGIVDSILKFVAGAKGIPQRILVGSERGELASTQDRANWYGTVQTRQNTFAEPVLLRPLVNWLVDLGALADPNGGTFEVQWPNLFELNELEQADVEKTRSTVLKNIPGISIDGEQAFSYVKTGAEPEFEDVPEPEALPDEEQLLEMMESEETPEQTDGDGVGEVDDPPEDGGEGDGGGLGVNRWLR